jgi:hypothetical protein
MVKVNNVINGYLNDIDNNKDESKIRAAASLKELLVILDLNAEIVFENDLDIFGRLVTLLKGGKLNKNEIALVKEIFIRIYS